MNSYMKEDRSKTMKMPINVSDAFGILGGVIVIFAVFGAVVLILKKMHD